MDVLYHQCFKFVSVIGGKCKKQNAVCISVYKDNEISAEKTNDAEPVISKLPVAGSRSTSSSPPVRRTVTGQ